MQMGQFGQYNGGMPGQGSQYQPMLGGKCSSGGGQPAPGLFSGGGALPSQSSTEQPRPAAKESTFDFVGVGPITNQRMILCLSHSCQILDSVV